MNVRGQVRLGVQGEQGLWMGEQSGLGVQEVAGARLVCIWVEGPWWQSARPLRTNWEGHILRNSLLGCPPAVMGASSTSSVKAPQTWSCAPLPRLLLSVRSVPSPSAVLALRAVIWEKGKLETFLPLPEGPAWCLCDAGATPTRTVGGYCTKAWLLRPNLSFSGLGGCKKPP